SEPLPIDPGPHTIEVVGRDGRTHRQQFNIAAETTAPVDVEAPSSTPADQGPTSETRPNPFRIVGIVAAGVGVAAAGVGAGLGAAAVNKKSTVEAHCTGARCDGIGFKAQQDAWSFADASTISLVAGAVLVAAGITLAVLAKPTPARVMGSGRPAL